jgi:hypothetical protein
LDRRASIKPLYHGVDQCRITERQLNHLLVASSDVNRIVALIEATHNHVDGPRSNDGIDGAREDGRFDAFRRNPLIASGQRRRDDMKKPDAEIILD